MECEVAEGLGAHSAARHASRRCWNAAETKRRALTCQTGNGTFEPNYPMNTACPNDAYAHHNRTLDSGAVAPRVRSHQHQQAATNAQCLVHFYERARSERTGQEKGEGHRQAFSWEGEGGVRPQNASPDSASTAVRITGGPKQGTPHEPTCDKQAHAPDRDLKDEWACRVPRCRNRMRMRTKLGLRAHPVMRASAPLCRGP